jgi:hypothetical protein
MFEKHGISMIRDFTENMYRQYGVWVAILGGYCDGDGKPAMMLYVLNTIYCVHGLTTHHIAMITITSLAGLPSKPATKTGRRTQW